MTQIAFPSPLGVERIVAASVQAASGPPSPKERLASFRDEVAGLELYCAMPQAREVNPARFRILWGYTKVLRETLHFELLQLDADESNAMRPHRDEVMDLLDRADELVDTFLLAANTDELLPVFEAELG